MLLLLLGAGGLLAVAPDGATVYREACASCHDSGVNRAPPLSALRLLTPGAIETSLRSGVMAYVGETMSPESIASVSSYLGKGTQGDAQRSPEACPEAPWPGPGTAARWSGWGPGFSNSRFQPAASAGLDPVNVPRLRLQWVFGFRDANTARSQPTVAGGRLFVGSGTGRVHALDAKTGCSIWEFAAAAEVRTAIVVSVGAQSMPARVYFGDMGGHLYSVDAASGELRWKTRVDDHSATIVSGSPVLFEERVFVGVSSYEEFTGSFPGYPCCSFRGSVAAYDARSGRRLWKTHTIPEEPSARRLNAKGTRQHGPSGAAVWSTPTIDPQLGRLYVTTGDNYSDPPTEDSDAILAFDLKTGTRLWSRQFTAGDAYNMACNPRADRTNCPEADGPDHDFGASAILADLGGGQRVLVAGQKSGMVHAVDPDRDGTLLWQQRAGRGGVLGGIQFGPAADDGHVFVAVSDYIGSRRNRAGGITAYRLADGEPVWHTPGIPCPRKRKGCSPAQSAAVTAIPGIVFSGALDGFLRAYSTDTGEVVWSHDTVREFPKTVNGVPATGGSLNGPGPTVVDGMVYVNSGYGQFGSIPGNALLAFAVDPE